jgi:hypothetical protein
MSIRVYSVLNTLGTYREGKREVSRGRRQRRRIHRGQTHVAVVGGGGQILVLLASEDVNAHEVALGVSVLAGLGGGHVRDLGRARAQPVRLRVAPAGCLAPNGTAESPSLLRTLQGFPLMTM